MSLIAENLCTKAQWDATQHEVESRSPEAQRLTSLAEISQL